MIAFVSTEKTAIKWLARLESPELTAVEEAAFFAWLKSSKKNQAAFIRAEKLWHSGTAHSAHTNASPKVSQPLGWPIYATACTLVLVVALAFFTLEPTALIAQEYRTSVGEQGQYTLSDNSVISLNTNTRLIIGISNHYRRAELSQGEAYFDIEQDPSKPFELTTKFGLIRVLGTRFSVKQTHSDAIVTVVSGKVSLTPNEGSPNTTDLSTTIGANEQLSMKEAGIKTAAQQVDALALTAWLNKQLVYKGTSLNEVIADLNRYFDTQIVLGDPRLSDKQVIAVIQLDNINRTLNALSASLGLHIEYSPDRSVATLTLPPTH